MSKEETILRIFLRIYSIYGTILFVNNEKGYSIELSTKEENIIIPESIPAIKERLKELKEDKIENKP